MNLENNWGEFSFHA